MGEVWPPEIKTLQLKRVYNMAAQLKSLLSSLARPLTGFAYVPRPRAATSVATRIPAGAFRNSENKQNHNINVMKV